MHHGGKSGERKNVAGDFNGAFLRGAFDFLQALGPNGVFVFTGVPGRKAPVEVDTDLLMRNLVLKNQVVLGTVNAGRDAFAAAIASLGVFMEKWPGAVRGLITGRYAIEDFADPLSGKAPGIKNVIDFGAKAGMESA